MAPEIVHLYDICKEDSDALLGGGLDERTAYFWSHAAYCSNAELVKEMASVFGLPPHHPSASWCKLSVPSDRNSPKILAYQAEDTHIVSVMGTKRSEDLKAVLDFAFDNMSLAQKIENAYHTTFKNVLHSDLLLEIVLEYLDRLPKKARVHPGIYFRAYQTLNILWQYLETRGISEHAQKGVPRSRTHEQRRYPSAAHNVQRIYLYGHSLGAACATLAYVWLRDIYYKGGRDIFGTLQIKCACIACPMFCDDRAWYEWFHSHTTKMYASQSATPSTAHSHLLETLDVLGDDESAQVKWSLDNYRHYYTYGDIFVREIPALAGFTRAFSNVHYVCPDASDHILSLCHSSNGAEGASTKECSTNEKKNKQQKKQSLDKLLLTHSSLQETRIYRVAGNSAETRSRVYVKLPKDQMPRAALRASIPIMNAMRPVATSLARGAHATVKRSFGLK